MHQPGDILHTRYTVRQVLRRGLRGTLYLCEKALSAGRKVAIRVTDMQEVHLLGGLQHPGLPDLNDYFEEAGSLYLVMEHVDGQTLASLLQQHGQPFPFPAVEPWMRDILSVLDYLHQQSPPLVALDLSPGNLLITADGRLRLMDACVGNTADPSTFTAPLPDMAAYVAPEQQGGVATYNEDIYGAGAVLYTLLAGQAPPSSMHRLLGSVGTPALSSSQGVAKVVLGMMEPLATRRFATVEDVRKALASALHIAQEPPAQKRIPWPDKEPAVPPLGTPTPRTERGPSAPEKELQVKRPAQKQQPLTHLPPAAAQRTCPGCGTPLASGPLCARCMAKAPLVVVQPRPPELPEEPPERRVGTSEGRKSLLGRLRRDTTDASGMLTTIDVGPPILRRVGETRDIRIQVIGYRPPMLEFNASTWLEVGQPVVLSLAWERDGVRLGQTTAQAVARTLRATASHWRYSAEMTSDLSPELTRYLQAFEQRRSTKQATRRDNRLPCKFRITSSDLPLYNAISADISPRGLSLFTSGPVEVGAIVTLNLDFDDYRYPPVVCKNEVRWCQYGPDAEFRVGTVLVEMSPEHLAILNSYLASVHHQRIRWNV